MQENRSEIGVMQRNSREHRCRDDCSFSHGERGLADGMIFFVEVSLSFYSYLVCFRLSSRLAWVLCIFFSMYFIE